MFIHSNQVKLNFEGGNFTTLEDFAKSREVYTAPLSTSQVLSVTSQNYALLDSTKLPAATIAKDTTTTQSNGAIFAASLVGAIGAGAITSANIEGAIANLVEIRDSVSNDPVSDVNGRKVYGLVQCDNGVTDGASVAASGSENLQLSFVIIDDTGTLNLTVVDGTFKFYVNKIRSLRNRPALGMAGGSALSDIPDTKNLQRKWKAYTVSAAVAPTGMQINLSTDAVTGNGSAVITPDADSNDLGGTPLPNTGTLFKTNASVKFFRNGLQQDKGKTNSAGDVGYVSSTTIQLNTALAIGETIYVEVPGGY